MNLLDLSPNQLKRAAAIKEQIDRLNAELRGIFGGLNNARPAQGKTRTMSAAAKRKIAAAQKARWANFRRGKSDKRPSGKATRNAKSPATRAKLSAKMKAYWAAKRAGKGATGKSQTKTKA
ncbi:MAG TPA: hypothetical protein VGH22_21625 [Candidatus Binatia bacterium]|jgi:hypothetical protein